MTLPAYILLALALAVFISGGAALYALVAGYKVVSRLLRDARDCDAILLKSPLAPGISLLALPQDASVESRAWVRRLLELHYGSYEVVVVLDGVEPLERDRWLAEFHLGPAPRKSSSVLKSAPVRGVYESYDPIQLVLVDKEKGGKADALNAGVNTARFPLIGTVDRGSRVESNLLLRLVRPLLEEPDEAIAVCGIAPSPDSDGWAARLSECAFLRNWLIRCAAFRGWDRLLPVPGAAVLVRRDAVLAAHGFRTGVADLCLRLLAAARIAGAPCRIGLVADPVVFSKPVAGWRDLGRDIRRDQAELARLALRWPRGAGSGRAGLLWYQFLAPLLESAGYPFALAGWLAGWFDGATAAFFLLASGGTGLVVSTAAVVLPALAGDSAPKPSHLKQLFMTACLENLGYRQVRNLQLISGFFGKAE